MYKINNANNLPAVSFCSGQEKENANPNIITHSNNNINLNTSPSNLIGQSLLVNKSENAIFVDKFLKETDDEKSARMLIDKYPELKWLTGDANATPEGKDSNSTSISEKLFGKKSTEFDRTIVGINCLKYVLNNDYDAFTKCQKDAVKLTPEKFEHLRTYTLGILKTPDDVDAMLAYTATNDLGKIKEFVADVEQKIGRNVKDHDEALILALKTFPEKIPSFNRLSEHYKENLINGLSADFNMGQFVQAECLEGNLTGLKDINQDAINMYIVHLLYDVAGAAGHVNPNGSLVMTEPVYSGYMQGIDAIKGIKDSSEIEVYNNFLTQKANYMNMPLSNNQDRALLKLAIMSRASNTNDVKNINTAFNKLSDEEKESLITGINKNGIDKPGVLLYYTPAFIQNCTSSGDKVSSLQKAFSLMSKIYKDNENVDSGIKVITLYDIANAIKETNNLTADELYSIYKNDSNQ